MRVHTAGVLFAMMAVSAPAAADESLRLHQGLFAGSHVDLASWDLNDSDAEADAESSGIAGLSIGVVAPGLLWGFDAGLELDLGFIPVTSTAGVANATVLYALDGHVYLMNGPYQPYALLGFGAYTNIAGDLGPDTDVAYRAGGGFRGVLTDWLAARAEAAWIVTDGWPLNSNLSVALGVELNVDID
jgi:hypothetical protein